MTEDFPDGSVGRYVRERWGALPETRTRRASRPAPELSRAGSHPPVPEPAEPRVEPEPPAESGGDEPGRGLVGVAPRTGPSIDLDDDAADDIAAWAAAGAAVADGSAVGGSAPAADASTVDESATVGESSTAGEAGGSAVGQTAGGSAARDGARPVNGAPAGFPDTARGPATSAAPGPAPAPSAPDRGTAERAAARRMWASSSTEIRAAAPRPSTPDVDLSSARLLHPGRRPVPQSGWRRALYVLSGRLVNPGESPAELRRRELAARVSQPLLGCYKIAMLSLKGGVGKTTMTATLGATFASMRGDRVVAVDANPDRGTLSQKIPLETSATVRHLLRDAQRVRRYTDVRAYTSQGPSRLEVLASEQDPAVSEAFAEEDYRRTITLLEHFYNIVLTDCGTGLMHSAMYGVLGVADQLVIVSSGSIDGARSASATMDWLDAHGHSDLVRNSVAVINSVRRKHGAIHLDRVAEHFASRCRAVVRVPFDEHLGEGAEIDLDRLQPETRLALLELAAAVADSFSSLSARG